MFLITIIILCVLGLSLILCTKSLRGHFRNSPMIDLGNLRTQYTVRSFGTNNSTQAVNNYISSIEYGDASEAYKEQGNSGYFTNRERPDGRYLEDGTRCWSEKCLDLSTFGGESAEYLCGKNKIWRVGGNNIILNKDISDPSFEYTIAKNNQVYLPDSLMYNNIYPANPLIR